jgi:predicted RNase H-like nuclease
MADVPSAGETDEVSIAGVDGFRDGWVVATLAGDRVRWTVHTGFAGILAAYPAADIGIDIPIGLPAAGAVRACDVAARQFLGRARSSVFLTPPRATLALHARDPRHPIGQGISRQSWNLLPKIAEVDALMDRQVQQRVAEVHPECSFRTMAPELDFGSKKSGRGVGQRLRALRAHFELPDLADAPPGPGVDDLLDATAVAWTARRWRAGQQRTFPPGRPQTDERGVRMQILA